jgi:hypothetical protein
MAIPAAQVKRAICTGLFKVLYHRNLVWNDIKGEDISTLFQSVANPTSWPTFFVEAVGTSIQQELVLRGSYCPQLEQTLVQYDQGNQTWDNLDTFIQTNVRNCQSPL